MKVDFFFFGRRIDEEWGFEFLISPDLTGYSHSGPLRFVGEEKSNWIDFHTRKKMMSNGRFNFRCRVCVRLGKK